MHKLRKKQTKTRQIKQRHLPNMEVWGTKILFTCEGVFVITVMLSVRSIKTENNTGQHLSAHQCIVIKHLTVSNALRHHLKHTQ